MFPVLKLTLCPIASLLVHTTVAPALTVIVAGPNLKFEIVTAVVLAGCFCLLFSFLCARVATRTVAGRAPAMGDVRGAAVAATAPISKTPPTRTAAVLARHHAILLLM